jgi:hypothetical protein
MKIRNKTLAVSIYEEEKNAINMLGSDRSSHSRGKTRIEDALNVNQAGLCC